MYDFIFQMQFNHILLHPIPHRHVPPTPGGVSASNILKTIDWCSCHPPCSERGGDYHFSTTRPGSCYRGVAVISERRCMVNLKIHYSCCYGANSAPLPVVLELGMNVFIYCVDNFDGGELAVTPLPDSPQRLYPTVMRVEWGCLMNYVFDFDSAPPWALVVTGATGPFPIPQLSSLARIAIGEADLGHLDDDDVPSCVRRTSYKFVVNKYVCSVCRVELP